MPTAFEKENKEGLSVFLLLFQPSLAEGVFWVGDFFLYITTHEEFFFLFFFFCVETSASESARVSLRQWQMPA